MIVKEIDSSCIESIEALFVEVFSGDPWNDDWSDRAQLRSYLRDIMDCPNSLSFALYDGLSIVGAALGFIVHWYTGSEFYVREFFVHPGRQGSGLGTFLLRSIEEGLRGRELRSIVLNTERNLPAYHFYVKNGFVESIETRFLHKGL
ncbi:MAG: GNAT family N-acetyltransferase [Spirochaetales bacterium]|nr:GNAT family N-acetyltransferase [Spirochaetales bacterium]